VTVPVYPPEGVTVTVEVPEPPDPEPVVEPELDTALRRAADEAASVAWFTPFPLLFLPTLLEEKAASAFRHEKRQREIRQRTEGLLDEAVSN